MESFDGMWWEMFYEIAIVITDYAIRRYFFYYVTYY